MNLSKKFKKDNDDDDVIIIEPSSIINEFCQHIDKKSNENCREYYSVLCIHCNLYICYIHVEIHRILLINERDQLIDELNERIDELNRLGENPERIQKMLIEKLEVRNEKKVPFIQQLAIEKLFDLNKIIIELKQLFQPIRIIFSQNQCVSFRQIKKIKETFIQFDHNKKVIVNKKISIKISLCQ
jgi:hypothetical protein